MKGLLRGIIAGLVVSSTLIASAPVVRTEASNGITTSNATENKTVEGIDKYLENGRYTVLLLGVDGPQDTGQRSDSIMIAQFNKDAKEIRIISMPRDSNMDIPGHGFEKATHAFAYGGGDLTQQMITNNLDIPLNGYMALNFSTFPQFIDQLGGVTLELSGEEAQIAVQNGNGGTYTLNGAQALTFGRIRKIDSDYMRTGRHRRLMHAILDKIKSYGVGDLKSLSDSFAGMLSTNLDINTLYELGKYAYENDFKIVDTLIPDEENSWGNTIDGAWVLEFDIPAAKQKMKEFFEK